LAAGSQQAPAAVAASAVPQHVAAVVGVVVVVGAVPQQPLEAGGVKASAGSPANPPIVSLVIGTPCEG
jgi:hypothetical protein